MLQSLVNETNVLFRLGRLFGDVADHVVIRSSSLVVSTVRYEVQRVLVEYIL